MAAGNEPIEFYGIVYEQGLFDSLERLEIPLELFERLADHSVDTVIARNPYEPTSTFQVPGLQHRYFKTLNSFLDVPPLLIAFRVDAAVRTVYLTGAVADPDAVTLSIL